jgi:hypothetical protein
MNHHESPLASNRHQGTLDICDIRDQDLEEEDDPPKRGALLHGCRVKTCGSCHATNMI